MANQRPYGKNPSRYQAVNSADTRAAYRRNMFLMLVAAIGIALSFTIPRMCPAQSVPASGMAEELQQNLASSFGNYQFDVQESRGQDGQFRCTVYVIAGREAESPETRIVAFERLAFSVYGEQEGEVVWRFYRQAPEAVGGDPAFIGLHRSDIRELARRFGSSEQEN